MHQSELIFFGSFLVGILLILIFDLGVLNRHSHVIRFREAMIWTVIWVTLGLGFYVFLLFQGHLLHGLSDLSSIQDIILRHKHPVNINGMDLDQALQAYRSNLALEYLTGYLIEYALSVDNVFVMIMIFYGFGVKEKYFKWILFWG
ncbi:MAG TPA: TerC family protein, partial [Bacteroidales bacterium]|nr:TerC family protein [Bacteroidales bacterium]